MGRSLRVGDRVRGHDSATGTEQEGVVVGIEVPHRWSEIVEPNRPESWIEHNELGCEVHWDNGNDSLESPEDLLLLSRPEEAVASVPHTVRHIGRRLIEGDIVETKDGERGTIIVAENANGDYMIDMAIDGIGVWAPAAVAKLRLVERPARMPGETEPDPTLPEPRSHRWHRIDVDTDDRTMWIHYLKDILDRLHSVHVEESENEVRVALFLARVDEPDPRWTEALRYGPVDWVPESTRFTLTTDLGTRVCIEVIYGR